MPLPKKRRARGEGGLRQDQRTGYWIVEVEQERGPDKKRQRKKLYGKTQAEVIEKRRAFERDQRGLNIDPKQTIEQFLLSWLEHVASNRNRAHTIESSYEPIVRLHLIPHIGHHRLNALRPQHVQAMINRLKKDKKPRTVRNVRAVLRRALNQAIAWSLIKENAAEPVELPVAEKPKHHPLNADQAQTLLDTVVSHRLEALFWLALLLGLREGELIGLRIDDIDFDQEAICIEQQIQRIDGVFVETPTKTGGGAVVLPLPPVLIQVLRAHLARLEEELQHPAFREVWKARRLLFPSQRGTPIEASNLWRTFQALLKRAGLPAVRFHDLRHSCGTLLYRLKVEPRTIMAILRHTQISTTMNIYVDGVPEVSRQAVMDLSALFSVPDETATIEIPRRRST